MDRRTEMVGAISTLMDGAPAVVRRFSAISFSYCKLISQARVMNFSPAEVVSTPSGALWKIWNPTSSSAALTMALRVVWPM